MAHTQTGDLVLFGTIAALLPFQLLWFSPSPFPTRNGQTWFDPQNPTLLSRILFALHRYQGFLRSLTHFSEISSSPAIRPLVCSPSFNLASAGLLATSQESVPQHRLILCSSRFLSLQAPQHNASTFSFYSMFYHYQA